MAKFLILYNSTATAAELMANASVEQMKASINEWTQWKLNAEKSAKFEFGMPIEAVSTVTASEIRNSTNQASGYSIMEGEKDIITKLLQSHPHLQREGATIDVLEMLAMPGIQP